MKVELSAKDKKLKNYIIGCKEPEVGDMGVTLPKYFPLDKEGKCWMKRRKPLVIRFHKFKVKENPHEYYYSEMQKYLPYRDEINELKVDSLAECKAVYDKHKDKIKIVRGELLKHLKSVEAARDRAEEIIANDVGSILDSTKEQDDEECDDEGTHVHPDLYLKEPLGVHADMNCAMQSSNIYRKIELEKTEDICTKAQMLDEDQSLVLQIGLDYAKSFVKSIKSKLALPIAPLTIVHGGAGTGKSTVIHVLSQMLEQIFRQPGDDPNNPYIIKSAFTGNAALIIGGQTLHSAFNFTYGN